MSTACILDTRSIHSVTRSNIGAYIHWVLIFIWVPIHGKPVHAVDVGAYIHGVLILYGCLLSRFYGINVLAKN